MQEQPSTVVSVCCAGCGFQVSQVSWQVAPDAQGTCAVELAHVGNLEMGMKCTSFMKKD